MQTLISPETRSRLQSQFVHTSKNGLVRTLVVLVIGIIVISVLGFDIRSAIEHPQTQTNFSYLGQGIIDIWDAYLAPVWAVVWNIVGPIFEWFWGNAENFQWDDFNQQGQDFLDSAPTLPGLPN